MANVAATRNSNGEAAKMSGTTSNGTAACPVPMQTGQLPMEGRLFINGEFRAAKSGKTWENLNPYSEKVLTVVHDAGEEDVDDAFKAADAAFQRWSKVDAQTRAKLLLRILQLVQKHRQQLAEMEAMDSGKALKDALDKDMKLCEDVIRFYAGEADRIHGSTFNHQSTEMEGGNRKHFSYTRREPVGVCAQIVPWNFPLLMAVWKVAPVIAAGCTTVIKSSERTPLSLMAFAAILNEAGVMPGVVNCISGGPATGEMMVKHPLVRKVAHTGSIRAGKRVAVLAAEHGLKRVSLELGGKSPLVIFDDADLDEAVKTAHDGINFNMGEVCCASSRVYVHEGIWDRFFAKLLEKSNTEVAGDPLDMKTTIGPLIDKRHFDCVKGFVEKAEREGAKIACGGDAVYNGKLIFKPTIIHGVTDDMTIVKEEVFGPVVCLLKFKDEEDVIRRANNTHYGLSAGLFTKDVGRAHRVAHALEAGSVYINGWGATDAGTPFGGYKSSGWGRELGPDGMNMYLETKTVVVHLK